MTDEQAHETPRGMPGRRALGAMESAVLRARASQGGPPPPLAPPPMPSPRHHPRVTIPTSGTETAEPSRLDRWLIISVVVVGALVVAATIALVVSLTGTSGPTALPASTATTPAPTHAGAAPRAGGPQVKGHHGPAASGATRSSSTTTPAAAGGPPVISSLAPSSGSAGQSVQVAGANFLSSSGQIVAAFNGQVAPTSCPAPNICTVTVPPSSAGRSAQVTITTASGTSNAVTFTYSSEG